MLRLPQLPQRLASTIYHTRHLGLCSAVLQVYDAVAVDAAGRTVAFNGASHCSCCRRRHVRTHRCVPLNND